MKISAKSMALLGRDIVKSGVWLVCSMKRQAASFC